MPPKRKGGAAKGAGSKKKKVEEPEPAASTFKDAINKLKTAEQGKAKVRSGIKVDSKCPYANTAQVYLDYDCMLNQTNIGHNNNKYYIIQVLKLGNTFYCWNRWGRVGEDGSNAIRSCMTADQAIADFKKKFKDKTKNDWDKRENFTPVAGKYTLLEMEDGDDDGADAEKLAKLDEIDGVKSMVAKSKLDSETQLLMKLIFDNDMFKNAMANLEIDVKKMPLGKLSKSQIAKGFEVLEGIEAEMGAKPKPNKQKLEKLCSQFYTVIPHNFGRMRPPLIEDEETLKKKYDMLAVLGDIEIAQSIKAEKDKRSMEAGSTKEIPNPIDINYELLNADLELVDKKSTEFKVIETYTKETAGAWRTPVIQQVWRVNRHGEDKRFQAHDGLGNRKLLWHGTNVAVVAAILKSGLRIMPHSGGRVGKGIYFASENSKSAGYVRCSADNTGIMFLNEVALGKEHHIAMDDWRLTQPPKGYDSIVAKGHTEPDPKKDTTLQIDGKTITVPQGKPLKVPSFSHSSFSQSEYLIYNEAQNRIRYLLKMKF